MGFNFHRAAPPHDLLAFHNRRVGHEAHRQRLDAGHLHVPALEEDPPEPAGFADCVDPFPVQAIEQGGVAVSDYGDLILETLSKEEAFRTGRKPRTGK